MALLDWILRIQSFDTAQPAIYCGDVWNNNVFEHYRDCISFIAAQISQVAPADAIHMGWSTRAI